MKHLFIISILFCTFNFNSCQGDSLPTEKDSPHHLIWHWEEAFSENQKGVLKKWIATTWVNTQNTLGQYPFNIHVLFYHSNSSSAVSFGMVTRKNKRNEAHFYVNPNANFNELKENWIAPHEFSHLSIPFLGRKDKWFSEGFATFLSRQIMLDDGVYTEDEFNELYERKISDTKKYYNSSTTSFAAVSDSLLKKHIYGGMYWGGAGYFQTMNKKLKAEKNMRFVDVMKQYQACCRTTDKGIDEVVQSFDNIIEETWFTDLLRDYNESSAAAVMKNY